jgi:predicted enzyme related to lactoylglutathione lyase
MIDSISAVWLPVTDMNRSVEFYRDTLGLDVVQQEGGWTEVTAGDQIIGLNDAESPAGDGGAVIAFNVSDIDQTVSELKDRGVKFRGGVSEHPWGRIAPFTDPDGNSLQVIQRAS